MATTVENSCRVGFPALIRRDSFLAGGVLEETRVYRPCRALQPYIERLWTRSSMGTREPFNCRWVLPHSSSDMVIQLGDAFECVSFLAGTHALPKLLRFQGVQDSVGVRFTPIGAAAFFGFSQDELNTRWAPLDAILGGAAASLESQLTEAFLETERVQVLERFFLSRLSRAYRPERTVSAALQLLGENEGTVSIRALSKHVGYSRRHLNRVFRRTVGMSPKVFCRLTRFHSAVDAITRRPKPHWASLAYELGYSDQAHLIREVKSFSRHSPRQLADRITKDGEICRLGYISASQFWTERARSQTLATIPRANLS